MIQSHHLCSEIDIDGDLREDGGASWLEVSTLASLDELTDPGAVRLAMARFDEMGRDEFLRTYGFGPARKFWLTADGKRYDSKAIVGVAWGIQNSRGLTWLSAEDFSGGEATVRRKLESLGFSVIDATSLTPRPQQTWIFQGNPTVFDVSGFLATLPRDFLWLANQQARRMSPGDKVFIWQAIGNGDRARSGIVAEAEIIEPARQQADDPRSQAFWRSADTARNATELAERVRLRLLSVAKENNIFQRDVMARDPVLGKLPILTLRNSTNFLLTTEQSELLEAVWSDIQQVRLGVADETPPSIARPAVEVDIEAVQKDILIDATTRAALIDARRGQGAFRRKLLHRWRDACAATGIAVPELLRASHTKPWRRSTNSERLDPCNGLLLAAHLDALYDCGLISFDDGGLLLISDQLGYEDWVRLHLPRKLRLELTAEEKVYLAFHRQNCFRS